MNNPAEPAGYILAFDYGLRHIGVAAGQTVTRSANPLQDLTAKRGTPDWRSVDALVSEWRPVRILVGLPLNMDDTDSSMSMRTRRFAATLHVRYRIPVSLVDERLSSREVRSMLDEQHASNRRSNTRTRSVSSHGLSACVITQTWFG